MKIRRVPSVADSRDVVAQEARGVKAIVRTLVDQIEARIANIPNGKCLTVNVGETHDNPLHKIFKTHLLHVLHARGIATGFAREANILELCSSLRNISLESGKRQKVNDALKGNLELRSDFAAVTYWGAGLSFNVLSEVVSSREIPYAFVDAQSVDHVLVTEDPMTLRAVQAASEYLQSTGREVPYDLWIMSALGMTARNIHMFWACKEFASKSKDVQVMVLSTGAIHVAGHQNPSLNFPYTDSLADMFQKDKHPYMGVILGQSDNNIPPEAVQQANLFWYGQSSTKELRFTSENLEREDQYLKAMLAHFEWSGPYAEPLMQYNEKKKLVFNSLGELSL